MDPVEKFYNFHSEVVHQSFPQAKIKFKSESRFMKFLNLFISVFNKQFMTNYTTVIGTTVYLPSLAWLKSCSHAWEILAHEYVHMVDRRAYAAFGFELRYLFPQILGALGLLMVLAFVHPLFLLFAFFFLFLAPLPAKWRLKFEINGYAMDAFIRSQQLGFDLKEYAFKIGTLLSGKEYYYPAHDAAIVRNMFLDRYQDLVSQHTAFLKVKEWLEKK